MSLHQVASTIFSLIIVNSFIHPHSWFGDIKLGTLRVSGENDMFEGLVFI